MSVYRGDPRTHAHNERRAAIVRQHRRRMLEELRELDRVVVDGDGEP